ncbi:MAG TPA: ATP-binding protein [Clostridiaceae bacterium]|nr:ATP-binding protein [Clostridiaceae bacterium]
MLGINIYSAIKAEYDKRQKAAYDALEQRKSIVYEKIPRLREIDEEIQTLGLKYNKKILLTSGSKELLISDFNFRIGSLKEEKIQLLEEAGFPKDYLEPVYQCSQCKDTGFISTQKGDIKCACYKQQLINLLYSQSNLKLAEFENFSTFNENYYPDVVDEQKYGIKKSPRRQILGIKEDCLKFIENFRSPDTKNLFFCGPAGVGKTFMTNCIAVELLNRGITVLYQPAPVLFNTINEYKLRSLKDDTYQDAGYKSIYDVELLIIDDLGTESPSAARYADFLTLLSTRQANDFSKPCKTIISTNIDIKKMYEYYDERIVSRIIGYFDIYKFAGEDIRKLKILMEK